MHEHQPHPEHDVAEVQLGRNDEATAALARAIKRSPPADAPRVWIGSIEDYLDAEPHGRWISAARRCGELAADIDAMLERSPAARRTGNPSRWSIFASQGFGRHQPPPEASLHDIARRANAVQEDSQAFNAWARLKEGDRAHALRFGTVYQGRFDSLADWIALQVETAGWDQRLDALLPEAMKPFVEVNIDALAHDMLANGEVIAVAAHRCGGVWIFTSP